MILIIVLFILYVEIIFSWQRADGCPYVVRYSYNSKNCLKWTFRRAYYFGFDHSQEIFKDPLKFCYGFDSFEKNFEFINNSHVRWLRCDGCLLYDEYNCAMEHGIIKIDKCYVMTTRNNTYTKYKIEFGCL